MEQNRWLRETGGTRGAEYARRFAALQATGEDVHGEARFLDALLAPDSRVLDAGCGTGRVGMELARRGHHVSGIDLDASMIAQARQGAPQLHWLEGDLLEMTAEQAGAPLDLVVQAGNVVVYLTPGTEAALPAHLAGWLAPGGLLVAGFAADRHVSLEDYRTWCPAAGLREVAAHSGWDGAPLPAGSTDSRAGYAVVVHRR